MKNSTEEYRIEYKHNMSYSYKLAIFSETDYSVVYTASYSLEGIRWEMCRILKRLCSVRII